MTENQKINLAYLLALACIILFMGAGGFIGYFFGYVDDYTLNYSQNGSPTIEVTGLDGLGYLMRMVMPWRYSGDAVTPWDYMTFKTIFCGICAVIGAGLLKKYVPEKIASRWRDSVPEALFCVAVLILSLSSIAGDTYNPFINFQF